MVTAAGDAVWMERALFLAERGLGRTSPNPIVGAVVVSPQGIVVGQGAHLGAGERHAEVVALDEAGERARDGTLYCTLEPCSHTGRTGPCVERIVAAGVRRVVAATDDPNPQVSGRGFAYLRAHRIDVTRDVCREAADRQHAPFFTWITMGRPYVIVKTALSADGFVGRPGTRTRLTGAAADRFFHRQRAAIDAIAVGSETVRVDDPLLTPRGAFRSRPLTRLVFDWRGRIPAAARLFETLDAGPVIMVVTESALAGNRPHFEELSRRGVTIDAYARRGLTDVLARAAARGVVSLLVEGGPALQAAFTEAGLVDVAQVITTSVRLGSGIAGRAWYSGRRLARALGDDSLVEFHVHGSD